MSVDELQEEVLKLEEMVQQLNEGNISLETRPGSNLRDESLDTVKLPIVSSEESERIKGEMAANVPLGLHQRALRNLSAPDLNAMRKGFIAWIYRIFPILTWITELDQSTIINDVIAGLTVAVMLVPQSMSYADIAGLQYEYGLYAGFMPTFVYALMGTSRQLAVGPVAMVSLLVNTGLDGQLTEAQCPALYCPDASNAATCYPSKYPALRMAGEAPSGIPKECGAEYAKLAFVLSMLVGLIQFGAGVLKAGYLVAFLGHPVVSGFTSGAAVIIGLSQVKYIMGYDIPKSPKIYKTLENLFKDIGKTKYMPFILGVLAIATLVGFRKGFQKYPKNKFFKAMKPLGPLTMCVVGIALVYAAPDLKNDLHVKVVGDIPASIDGLWSGGDLQFKSMSKLTTAAISISIIGFMESISIAKALAVSHGYKLVPGQELVALGAANIVGSLFSAYPTTGSFSRSAVNNSVGCRTPLSGMVTAAVMLLTLTCLTPAFENLPTFVLGAIVISSVMNLFDYKEAIHLWTVKKSDFACWVFAFLGTLFLGVELGLLIAIALSLVIVIYESVSPQMSVLWSIPGTQYYRHVKQPESGNFIRGVLVVRIGASMYFANVANVQSKLQSLVLEMEECKAIGEVKYIVLDMTPVVTIDASAIHALEDMNEMWKGRNVQLCFANCGTRVLRTMGFAKFQKHIGQQWFLPETHLAVKYCVKHQDTKNEVLRSLSKEGTIAEPDATKPISSNEVESKLSNDDKV